MSKTRTQRFIAVMRLERVVLYELLRSFGLAAAGLTLTMVVAGAYEPIRDGLGVGPLVRLLPLIVPYALPWTIPMAFVAACIMVYGRMAADNELTAVRASGIHLWRVFTPAAVTALFLCVVCADLNHRLVPRTSFYRYGIRAAASASEQASLLRFSSDPIMRVGRFVIYMGDLNRDDTFTDIVIVEPNRVFAEPEPTESGEEGKRRKGRVGCRYLRAPRGRFAYDDERSTIVFHLEEDPSRNTPQDPLAGRCFIYDVVYADRPRNFQRAHFGGASIQMKLRSPDEIVFLPRRPKHLTTMQLILKLWAHPADRGPAGSPAGAPAGKRALDETRQEDWRDGPLRWRTEIHRRSALSLAPLLLGLIAVPVGVMTLRGRRIVSFAVAIGVVLGGYYPLIVLGTKLGVSGMLSPPLAIWGVTLAIAAVGVWLIRMMLKR